MNAYERLLLPDNLNYAWRKAKRLCRSVDGYADLGEIAEFELDLEDRLQNIRSRFRAGRYRLQPLQPLPRPKEIRNGQPIDRQYFHVPIVDQVAWLAIVNALGPSLDQLMPPWSYGNRLYRAAWYDEDSERQSRLEIGPYRHAAGNLYRKFQHSWPLFRRHVALTARTMASGTPPSHDDLEPADNYALFSAESSALPYLQCDFWQHGPKTNLHYASFDLQHFYPKLRSAAILKGFKVALTDPADNRLLVLLNNMLRFRLDKSGTPSRTLSNVEPPFGGRYVTGIPTGLFVSGFLANVAMLPVDSDANADIHRVRSIAHFRFVDDHTVLSYDFEGLCNWIESYEALLRQHAIGADINPDKYDPEEFGSWMGSRPKNQPQPTLSFSKPGTLDAAFRSTRIDGANPTPLLTKTLQQVSAIAVTNLHVLDDDDLAERLQLLEWLLLADIPNRELRSETRAAFAAGRIASLAPLLVQENERLVDVARAVAALESKAKGPSSKHPAATDEGDIHDRQLLEMRKELTTLSDDQADRRHRHLRRCFLLLARAFREFPSKARLFFRLHQYCRLTGYSGLAQISDLVRELRDQGRDHWADYYTGLSFQILAVGLPLAIRTLRDPNGLRSDWDAALTHLKDVASINPANLRVAADRETWFHSLARQAFGVALLAACHLLHDDEPKLSRQFAVLASSYVQDVVSDQRLSWRAETGYTAGVWAHVIESGLNVEQPSSMWRHFEPRFSYDQRSDRLAARRYPENLSDRAWSHLLRFPKTLRDTDVGWVLEAIRDAPARIVEARTSGRSPLARAARTCDSLSDGRWITLLQWTEFVFAKRDEFDPRRGEWTALEIVRQIVEPVAALSAGSARSLDYLHPNNVLLLSAWTKEFANGHGHSALTWEQWRAFLKDEASKHGSPRLRRTVADYRYRGVAAEPQGEWQRRLISVGRVLLGILRNNFGHPRLWNIRGNERVHFLSDSSLFASLSISTPTLALLDGCLSGRAAETRTILRWPQLFGWEEKSRINDAGFDPPLLNGPAELLTAIEKAQHVLVQNQLAIAGNQPRQLLPFRLEDFGTGASHPDEADEAT